MMNRSVALFVVLVLAVSCPSSPSAAEEPSRSHVQFGDRSGVAQRTEVAAGVGDRIIVVTEDQQAEIEVSVKRLAPDKEAIIYIKVQPRQGERAGTGPMSLPLGHWFRIMNANSGHYLSVEDESINAGAKLVQKVDTGDHALLWRLIPVDNTWYALQNRSTEQVASLPDNRKNAGANLIQVPLDKDSVDQQWRPLWLDDNRFVVVNRHSGQALAVAYGATHSGATICQWPLNIDWRQHQWRFEMAYPE